MIIEYNIFTDWNFLLHILSLVFVAIIILIVGIKIDSKKGGT
jgi:hypothetical protein